MLINRATEYAVIGLMYLAKNPDVPVDINKIAKDEKIRPSYLEKTFQKLSESKIVKPKFGPGGGFMLSKDPQKVTIFDLIKIFQAKQMHQCLNFKDRDCGRKSWCPFRCVLNEAKDILYTYFKKKTIQDLIDNSNK